MADWVTITDSQVDPDAPLTSELAYAWRDNPIAITEGAVGAPRVMPKALASSLLGVFSVAASPVAVTNIGWVKKLYIDGWVNDSGSTRAEFSSDNGATYGAAQVIIGLSNNNAAFRGCEIDITTGAYSTSSGFTGTLTVPSNVNAIRFSRVATSIFMSLFCLEGRSDV